jgi:Ca2+-binding RTX toxin-like protein
MRRTVLMLVVMVAAVLLSAGMVLAATVKCGAGPCRGTSKFDTMRGTSAGDRMFGFAGNDRMSGGRRGDVMLGGDGADNMFGGYGVDRMNGGPDNDVIVGNNHADTMIGGSGRDRIEGGQGDDVIFARDGESDSIDCGLGTDTVHVDQVEDINNATLQDFISVTSCETVDAGSSTSGAGLTSSGNSGHESEPED